MDKDARTEQQIRNAIDWCQNDDFWRANVMSMPTLRKQYDRLRLAAQRGKQSNAVDDDLFERAMQRAEAREAG